MKRSGLLAAIFDAPGEQDKPTQKKGPKKAKGESAATMPVNAAPWPAPKQKTVRQQTKDDARFSKMRATRRWVDGEISTKEHNEVHKRANAVLNNKMPYVSPDT